MSLIDWNESLSVGNSTADEHHKKIVDMLNALFDAMQEGQSKAVTEKILSALAVYTVKHFEYEERLFDQYNYPDSEEHKAQHAALTQQVMELEQQFKAGKMTISIDILHFLKKWLQEHIMESDMKYKLFLNQRGVY